MSSSKINVEGFVLQHEPKIICAKLGGRWLLDHTTPSWRIDDPIEGFQRLVTNRRAREIALAVLDQQRTFPNAIVLATDSEDIEVEAGITQIPTNTRFLIVDGQHRLWAQKFSDFDAQYGCLIHAGLSPEQMARLFLEINDNQKRVPASLRWDLVRLIQPTDDPKRVAAVDIVYQLAMEPESPFYQRIDLTGEQSELLIKQGSLAPEFADLYGRLTTLFNMSVIEQHRVILEFSIAIQQMDADRWGTTDSPFYRARVLRSLFRLLRDLLIDIGEPEVHTAQARDFIRYLERINEQDLDPERIRSMQGSAGMAAIYRQIKSQVFPV